MPTHPSIHDTSRNPYQPAMELSEAGDSHRSHVPSRCPICGSPVGQFRMILRGQRCENCQRVLRVYGSGISVGLTIVTAGGLLYVYTRYGLDPSVNGGRLSLIAGLLALFLAMTTLWFYLFGRPRLVSGWGIASKSKLQAERQAFLEESDRGRVIADSRI
ncbi:MAG: hypothetical protein AAGJ40_19270 [Planctomycetota bacterium]